jgi:hypothetical protein
MKVYCDKVVIISFAEPFYYVVLLSTVLTIPKRASCGGEGRQYAEGWVQSGPCSSQALYHLSHSVDPPKRHFSYKSICGFVFSPMWLYAKALALWTT